MKSIELMNYWIESSDQDYDTMHFLYIGKKYNWSLFVGHLVIEKLLKGLYVKQNKENPNVPKTHDLLRIAEKMNLEMTEKQQEQLDKITRFNIKTRYEDYKKEFLKKCTQEYTKEQIESIEEVRKWIKQLLIKK